MNCFVISLGHSRPIFFPQILLGKSFDIMVVEKPYSMVKIVGKLVGFTNIEKFQPAGSEDKDGLGTERALQR